jgi:phosphate starvation-inducible PhoH-like protein
VRYGAQEKNGVYITNNNLAENVDNSVVRISFDDDMLTRTLFGAHNKHLLLIEQAVGTKIHTRGTDIEIKGDQVAIGLTQKILDELYGLLIEGYPLYPTDIELAVRILSANDKANLKDIFLDTVYIASKKRPVTPKSLAQKEYIDAIRSFDIVFGIGPAGTGKTYLAMAMAVSYLTKEKVSRIILVRPAVEAGESLGFLPGDLYEKVNPYLRPLYDALHDMMHFDKANRLIQQGVIEVAPLAFMRGRTLNDSFIILDEAQNTTPEQMKMFLTRLGFGSKAVITGDITQIDLPNGTTSGLIEARDILQGIKGISFIRFSKRDVVRHKLVRDIIKAYEDLEISKGRLRSGS